MTQRRIYTEDRILRLPLRRLVHGCSALARVVRGRLLELREEDFVTAASISAASEPPIISGYLLSSFLSYLGIRHRR